MWDVQGFKLALYPDKEEGEEKERLGTRVGFTHHSLMFRTSFCILCLPPGVCLVSGYLCDFNHPPPPPPLLLDPAIQNLRAAKIDCILWR